MKRAGLQGWLCAALLALAPARAWAGPTVVLDPGHGGARSGTKTASQVPEKRVVLKIAQTAKRILERRGVRVLMTRAGDRHVDLAARTQVANRSGADVLVSIHANHAPVPERRGAETYILSAQASDKVTLALLAHEDEGAGAAAPAKAAKQVKVVDQQSPELAFILGDLERTAAHQDSALLARKIQDRLSGVRGLRPSRGLRQGPFKVLKGATMAAVLVEVGYLSNPSQAAYLSGKRGQQAAGRALAKGVLDYLKSRKATR